ncbi:MAG: Rne/Rng family ribonuclease [Candidatus Eisenbacteria bacterium]|nr:Rne/Rng family ribonuclease [Candidatus Eisenbacteria bacterium]
MYKEIIVNVAPGETRIAILEDHQLVEIMTERGEGGGRIVGDIYKGVVGAVLPGMQAAFVDIGQEKSAFLHVSDMRDITAEFSELLGDDPIEVEEGQRMASPNVPIQDLLQKGQEILVQVTKEPISTKGPRVTTQISLPGRFLVLVPFAGSVGVSRKIEKSPERDRLKEIAREIRPPWGGLIVRTAAEGASKRQIKRDLKYLVKLWKKTNSMAESRRAPASIQQEMGLTAGLVRDVFTTDVERLIVDSRHGYREIVGYLRNVAPELRGRVEYYKDSTPIFDAYEIEGEIEKSLRRKVYFKKGGYIVIDHAEALTAIDVNTGRYTGKRDQEETILKTNMGAAREIGRQLRLRDIGGIIVIDFIDMVSQGNREKVVQELKKVLSHDRARSKVYPISELGLVQMTRQRVRPSLLHQYTDPCPNCEGTGKVLSYDTILLLIERAMRRVASTTREKHLILSVSPGLAVHVASEESSRLRELEKDIRRSIEVRDESDLAREEFRVLSGKTGRELLSEKQE